MSAIAYIAAMITKKTEYAIRAMWELARHPEGLTTAGQVAEAQHIPPKYLPQIVAELVQAGLLLSSRGYRGGLKLNLPAEEISLLTIVEAVQGRLDLFECQQGPSDCFLLPSCGLREVYNRAQGAMEVVFRQTRLTDICFPAQAGGVNG